MASASEHSSRGRLRTRSRERLSKDRTREREREYDRNASYRSDARHRANVLTFDKIKVGYVGFFDSLKTFFKS